MEDSSNTVYSQCILLGKTHIRISTHDDYFSFQMLGKSGQALTIYSALSCLSSSLRFSQYLLCVFSEGHCISSTWIIIYLNIQPELVTFKSVTSKSVASLATQDVQNWYGNWIIWVPKRSTLSLQKNLPKEVMEHGSYIFECPVSQICYFFLSDRISENEQVISHVKGWERNNDTILYQEQRIFWWDMLPKNYINMKKFLTLWIMNIMFVPAPKFIF